MSTGAVSELTINGKRVQVTGAPARRLSDCLRDELGLTGTKVGCQAGDCGACTVLIDGEQACACLVAVGQCAGRQVTTIEGLATGPSVQSGLSGPVGQAGLSAIQQAFVSHGAAQCGICTPGMLMAATDVLRRHPSPTEQQVLDGLGGVLCRCTGYRKIVEAVLSLGHAQAAASAQAPVGAPASAVAAGQAVGARLPRFDALAKVRGQERFGADLAPPHACWLKVIRSPHPHAGFVLGDLDAFVAARPGLVGYLLPADIPNNRFAIFADLRDQPALAQGTARFRGEAVLVLAGDRAAIDGLDPATVPIQWLVKTPLLHSHEALADGVAPVNERWPDNVLCRGRVVRGDVSPAIAQAPLVHRASLETTHVEHAYIEPEAGYALWSDDPQGPAVTVFATTQTPYMDRDELAWMFELAPEQVRIIPSAVGGGFGGKLDLSIQPLLVAAARKFGRPARIVYSRTESMLSTTKRHPAQMSASLAADLQGRLLAYDFEGDFNTGAYSSWGPTVANRVPIHASGPYRIANVRALTRAVITHNSVAGAFRGFGVPQSTLINEMLVDRMAASLGRDPLDYRFEHALRAGDTTACGQRLSASVGLRDCLAALRGAWAEAREDAARFNRTGGHLRRGVGVACMWYGIGNTVIANPSAMTIGLKRDGRIVLYNGAVDIGQGTYTIMPQIAADALGVPVASIEQVVSDTALTLDAGKSSASRQTFVSGNAALFAARQLRDRLLALLGLGDDVTIRIEHGCLVGDAPTGTARVALDRLPADDDDHVAIGRGDFNPPTVPLDGDGQGVPYATYGFAAQFAQVQVDTQLGTVTVQAIHAAHDVGRAINPTQVEGQIHGGIAQGLGLALMEEYIAGRTDNLHDYLIPTVGDIPPITVHLIEDAEPLGPYGAKGVGEPALVATAPAIINAIHDATGVWITRLPATPDRVLAALSQAAALETSR